MKPKEVVLRLVGGKYEGQWWAVDPEGPFADRLVAYHQSDFPPGWSLVDCVPTGSVEWDGDRCAEVYVPADKLDLWRAEHQVDA